jgi:hypothetical protein
MNSFCRSDSLARPEALRLFLAVLLVMSGGACLQPGSFSVHFTWAGGSTPTFASPVYVFGRVEDYSSSPPGQLEQVGPFPYPGITKLGFSGIQTGRRRVVIVELHEEPTLTSPTRYYGRSREFDLFAGPPVAPSVDLELTPAPGVAAPVGVSVRPTGDPGFVKSETVALLLIPGSATAIQIANTSSGLDASDVLVKKVSDLSPAVEGAGQLALAGWDLTTGLSSGDLGLCNPGVEQSGCLRHVFARFVDSNGYASDVSSADVTVDVVPPGVSYSDLAPPAANFGSTVTVTVIPNETLLGNGSPAPAVAPLDGQPSITLSEMAPTVFIWRVGDTDHDGRFNVTFSLTDRAGNTTPAAPSPPLTLLVKTSAPPALDTTTPGNVVYTRIPWGNSMTAGQSEFNVRFATGSAPQAASVVVYDGPSPDSAKVIGMGAVHSDGSIDPVTLSVADRPAVYVGSIDVAGNASPFSTVYDIDWIATMSSANNNPHTLTELFHFDAAPAAQAPYLLAPLVPPPDPLTPQLSTIAPNLVAAPGDNDYATVVTSDSWQEANQPYDFVPDARMFGAMAYDSARGRTVLFGGAGNSDLLGDIWEWDGRTWTNVTPAGVGPPVLMGASMSYDAARGVTMLFGGVNTLTGSSAQTWEWDGRNWTLVCGSAGVGGSGPGCPVGRWWQAMTYDSARNVTIVFGGTRGVQDSLANMQLWDGATWGSPVFPPDQEPSPRQGHAMVFDAARSVAVLFGGHDANGVMNDTWEWDGTAWTQVTPAGAVPPARWGHTFVYDLVRGVSVLAGGCTDITCTAPPLNDLWEWNGTTWTEVTPANAGPVARSGAMAAYDSGRRQMVLFGGNLSGGLLNDLWYWDGSRWAERPPAVATPSPRISAALAYDSTRKETVLFGGRNTGGTPPLLGDTWEWDGNLWAQASLSGATPPARSAHGLAFDSNRGVTVLFGGCCDDSDNPFGDTWEWDGAQWTNRTPTDGSPTPPARSNHTVSFDSARSVTVVTGGTTATGSTTPGDDTQWLADTWEWDGNVWTEVTAPGPSGRVGAVADFDSVRGVTVLYGGARGASSILQDTWEWDGSTWNMVASIISLAGYRPIWPSMAFDSLRGVSLMFQSETTEWDGSAWGYADVPGLITVQTLPARQNAAMAFDAARGETVMFGGLGMQAEANLNDTWIVRSDTEMRPAILANISFAAAKATAPVFETIKVTAPAGGIGHTTQLPNPPPEVQGATLAVWSRGGWSPVAANTADESHPAALQYITTSRAEAASYVFGLPGAQTINVAVFPTDGRGAGNASAQVSLDYLEVEADYRQAENVCTTSPCACTAAEVKCGVSCVNLQIDSGNCGACGLPCAAGQVCIAGFCE